MKTLYNKLKNTFIDNPDIRMRYMDKGLRPIQHLDLYAGQDQNPEYYEINVYPAMYISFQIDHRQSPNLATITVRLCYEQLRDTSSVGLNPEDALKFFDMIELTDEILQTIETERFGKLVPATTDQQIEESVTDEFILVYNASFSKKKEPDATGSYNDVEVKGGLYKQLL